MMLKSLILMLALAQAPSVRPESPAGKTAQCSSNALLHSRGLVSGTSIVSPWTAGCGTSYLCATATGTDPWGKESSLPLFTVNSTGSVSIAQIWAAAATTWTCSAWVMAGTSTAANYGVLQGSWAAGACSVATGPGSASWTGAMCRVTGLSATQWSRVRITTSGSLSAANATLLVYVYTSAANTVGKSMYLFQAQCVPGSVLLPDVTTTTATKSVCKAQ